MVRYFVALVSATVAGVGALVVVFVVEVTDDELAVVAAGVPAAVPSFVGAIEGRDTVELLDTLDVMFVLDSTCLTLVGCGAKVVEFVVEAAGPAEEVVDSVVMAAAPWVGCCLETMVSVVGADVEDNFSVVDGVGVLLATETGALDAGGFIDIMAELAAVVVDGVAADGVVVEVVVVIVALDVVFVVVAPSAAVVVFVVLVVVFVVGAVVEAPPFSLAEVVVVVDNDAVGPELDRLRFFFFLDDETSDVLEMVDCPAMEDDVPVAADESPKPPNTVPISTLRFRNAAT